MQISAKSKAMKHIEEKLPRKFKNKPYSIRFDLAIDEVCPFSLLSSNYPIVLTIYNILPWMSVGKENLILTLIIPRKQQVKKWMFILNILLMRWNFYRKA